MPDITLALQISFSPDVLTAVNRLAAALERLPPSLPTPERTAGVVQSPPTPASFAALPVQPEAPGVVAPVGRLPPLEPAEGPSRAAGETHAGHPPQTMPGASFKGWMTPDRKARLRALWPTTMPAKQIRAELEKLSELPLRTNPHIAAVARDLGLKRPASLLPKAFPQYRNRQQPPVDPPAPLPPPTVLPLDRDTAAAPAPIKLSPIAAPEVMAAMDALFHSTSTIAPPLPPVPAPAIPYVAVPRQRIQSPPLATEPTIASQEAIRHWAAARGVPMDSGFDLAAANAKAHALGHPGFILQTRHGQTSPAAHNSPYPPS